MARPGLTQHRKFLRLARLLGSAPLALGCLEFLWEKCYQNGEPFLGDEIDVEAAAQWPGEPGALCKALLAAGGDDHAGFIEEVEGKPGRYQCHDLFDHAPRYVGKRLQREIARQEQGKTLSELRSDAGRKGATSTKRAANGQQADNKRPAKGAPPAPAPAPAPKTDSPEPDEPAAGQVLGEVVATLPCVGSGAKDWPITQGQVDRWQEAHPGLDVLQEIRKMRLWLEESPTRRKTYGGMGRFVVGWLGRAQDGGGRASPRVMPFRPAMAADANTAAQVQQLPTRKLAPLPPTGAP